MGAVEAVVKAAELLQRMRDGERPGAVCIRCVWIWSIKGEPCGRAVKTLERRKLIRISYYVGLQASADLE